MRGIQISLLVLTLFATVAFSGSDEPWSSKYTQPASPAPTPMPKKASPTPSTPRETTPPAEAPVSVWSPPISWWQLLPDVSRKYAEVSRDVKQTDDRLHRSIWGWLNEYPFLQFSAIILLSSTIFAVGQAWLRYCCASTPRSR